MNPWKISAQFAAFAWFTDQRAGEDFDPSEAMRFARENWIAFLPSAHRGVGRLLVAVARQDQDRKAAGQPSSQPAGARRAPRKTPQSVPPVGADPVPVCPEAPSCII